MRTLPIQSRIPDFRGVDNPASIVLRVLRLRTELYLPHEWVMPFEDLVEASGLSELTVKRAISELSQCGEVYSPRPEIWVAVEHATLEDILD